MKHPQLAPNSRASLLASLRPQLDETLDVAVGTTYSLDLQALLLVPLAFAMFDEVVDDDNPHALLAAVKQYAGRMTIYADQLYVRTGESASGRTRFLTFLEDAVVPVAAPEERGSFHPKLWCLRFRSQNGQMRHRILVLSRNMTFDDSWDLVARFDEQLDGDEADSAPLGAEAAAALRKLNSLAPSATARDLARTIGGRRFAIPEPFTSARLHVQFGGRDATDPVLDAGGERTLVISPFLANDRLMELASEGIGECSLVSRSDQLDLMSSDVLGRFRECMVIRSDSNEEEGNQPTFGFSRGLHAKLIVTENGESAAWFLGSANATTAALDRNVEAFVEMRGPRSTMGRDALFYREKNATKTLRFADLLEEYTPLDVADLDPDEEQKKREELDLAKIARKIAIAGCEVQARAEGDQFRTVARLRFRGGLANYRLELRMATSTRSVAIESAQDPVELGSFPAGSLTTLIAITLAGERAQLEFVVKAEPIGFPNDRQDCLVRDVIGDRGTFEKVVFLLLAAGDARAARSSSLQRALNPKSQRDGDQTTLPMFETLVRASARDPEKIREIDKIVRSLVGENETSESIPPGFLDIWKSVRRSTGLPNG